MKLNGKIFSTEIQ